MSDGAAATAISNLDLSKVVLAIGSLGTAAYGVVDATKCFGGGISNRGFGQIKRVVSSLIPKDPNNNMASSPTPPKDTPGLSRPSVLATLKANWVNGMSMADQKSVAMTLIRLNFTVANAKQMALATGTDPEALERAAKKMLEVASPADGANTQADGKKKLRDPQAERDADEYARFNLVVSALLDQAYQRADQQYRNGAKLLAIPVAVALAYLGAWALDGGNLSPGDSLRALIGGLLATPLAPIAKDLSTSIQAASKLAQAWKK